jgi:NitT/TauT family transport system ATP-binding protein
VALELAGVSKRFGDLLVIERASLKVAHGRVLCLLGPSGIGKTALLEIMSGLSKPDTGQATVNTPPSVLFQDNLLIPWLSALANVTYILPKTMGSEEAEQTARRWLETFGLEPGKFPQAMSGGMRRRLALARAMAAGRSLLLLDEPFAFLDPLWRELIATLVSQEAISGTAVALTGHSEPEELRALLPGRLDAIELASQPIRLCWP